MSPRHEQGADYRRAALDQLGFLAIGFALGWLFSEARARRVVDAALRRIWDDEEPTVSSGDSQPPSFKAIISRLDTLGRMATTDPLTGVGNRERLAADLSTAVETARRNGAWLGVCLIDIDRFKSVNDDHGHDAGDQVLHLIATRLRDALSSSETIYRYGGEEFLVVCPRLDVQETCARGEALRASIESLPIQLRDGTEVLLTASVGAAAAYGSKCRAEGLFGAADQAVYAAKNEGRNRVCAAPLPA